MLSRKRKVPLWPEKILTPMLSSSMKIKVNAYKHHCHDDATSTRMEEHTGKISETNSEHHPQLAPCRLKQGDNLY